MMDQQEGYTTCKMDLVTGSIGNSCIFFKEINSVGSFNVLEECLHQLLYRLQRLELFIGLYVFAPWTVFLTQARCNRCMFSLFVKIF